MKKIIIGVLVIIEIFSLCMMYQSNENKKLNEVNIKDNKINKNTFAIYWDEKGTGTYTEYTEELLPSEGYHLNYYKSECLDVEGNKIANTINYNNGNITLNSKYTSYCTLYYDMETYFEDLSGNNRSMSLNKDDVTMTDEGISIDADEIETNISPQELSITFTIVTRFKINDSLDVSSSESSYHTIFGSGACGDNSLENCHNLITRHYNNIIEPYTEFGYGQSHTTCFGNNIGKNVFYTITVVYDNGTMKYYNNGNLEKTEIMSEERVISTDNYNLFALNTFSDFLVFDRVLTDEEIKDNFSNTIDFNNINKQDLVLFYKFV